MKDRLKIVYEDKDIIVINKETNLLTISTAKEKENTLYHKVLIYLKKKNKNNKVFIVHRLDKDTSGLIIFAKSEEIKRKLQDNWDKLVTKKNYVAVVAGKLEEQKGTIKSWLKEDKNLVVYSSFKSGDGKLAITNYETVLKNNSYSLLSFNLKTGRKNQIRVHMKDVLHPIVGDVKYGNGINPIGRLGLHANLLEFYHPRTGKLLTFETDVPNEFLKLFKI